MPSKEDVAPPIDAENTPTFRSLGAHNANAECKLPGSCCASRSLKSAAGKPEQYATALHCTVLIRAKMAEP
jgi:hypothetical protein